MPVSKYLLPMGMSSAGWHRSKSPSKQAGVAQLADEQADSVSLHSAGEAEVLPKFEYDCHLWGERELRTLPTQSVAPAFVAELENGLSFGRHCCAITAEGKAVRETGFNLDGQVLNERMPVSECVSAIGANGGKGMSLRDRGCPPSNVLTVASPRLTRGVVTTSIIG